MYAKVKYGVVTEVVDSIPSCTSEVCTYIECSEGISEGMTWEGNSNFVLHGTNEETFKENRKKILDSCTWMHERGQSQLTLVNEGLLAEATWTTTEYREYLQWKQALRVIPNTGEGWEENVSWPIVPQHVFDDMDADIQLLCVDLECAPWYA